MTWIVVKYKKNKLSELKNDLTKKIGNNIKFYFPKIKYEFLKKQKTSFKEINLLDDYIFVNHEKFSEIKNLETDTNKIIENKSFNPDKKLASLEVEDLGFNYDDKKVIFRSVNIKLEKGLVYGICGPSGSGKSTFINLLLGFLKPNKGKIKFNNKIISENLREWRNNIGFVPQDIFLFDGTIKDNILLHLPENQLNKKDLDVSIKNANLDNFIKSLDNGIDTNIGEFGDKISGGQKQRIGIARSILNKPKILILDEFTSSLDNDAESKILNEISFLKKDKIIIIISHKLSTLSFCDKIFKLENQIYLKLNKIFFKF